MLTETVDRTSADGTARRHRRCSTASSTRRRSRRTRQRDDRGQAAGEHRPRHDRPGRQRARRVRHRDPAQQPARPAAGPRVAQHGPRPGHRHPAAERGAPRSSSRRPTTPRCTPYKSWVDFGFSLKHPESLVNFVAAYGTHPPSRAHHGASRRGQRDRLRRDGPDGDRHGRRPTTRRATGRPADAADFMSAPAPGRHRRRTTGLDDVDLWVGGLAEKHQPLRRPARHDVQLRVRDADDGPAVRRPVLLPVPHPGHEPADPARGQLVLRADPCATPTSSTLQADVVLPADCMFDLGQPAAPPGPILDDPATECNETTLLTRMPTATDPRTAAPASRRRSTAPPATTGSGPARATTPSAATTATTGSRAATATTSTSAASATTSSPTSR